MDTAALLFIGYSLFGALAIALTHFRRSNYDQAVARGAGLLLLGILAGLQWTHLEYLQGNEALLQQLPYRLLLFGAAPAFYLFARSLLLERHALRASDSLLLLSIAPAFVLDYSRGLPVAFLMGAAYLIALLFQLRSLRSQRARFRQETAILGGLLATALLVSLPALGLPQIGERHFVSLYAIAIGLALLLTSIALQLKPRLNAEISEAARESYAQTTLAGLDCPVLLAELEQQMQQQQLFLQPDLSLASLAATLGLSPHQLSELLNVHLGKSFPRYLHEWRVAAACRLLKDKPALAVLQVGLECGFSSQSAFYEAFREITGMTPGSYRRIHRRKAPD